MGATSSQGCERFVQMEAIQCLHSVSLEFTVTQTLISVYICNLIFLKCDKEFWKKNTASIFNYHPKESFQISATIIFLNHPTAKDTLKKSLIRFEAFSLMNKKECKQEGSAVSTEHIWEVRAWEQILGKQMGLVLFLFLLKPQFSADHLVVC